MTSPAKKSARPMTLPAKKRLHLIGSMRAMMPAYTTRTWLASRALLWWRRRSEWIGGPSHGYVALPPDEEHTTSPSKVKGRREGVGGSIEEGIVDDTTERQSEVARTNVVKAGYEAPPAFGVGGRVGPRLEDWAREGSCIDQCNDEVWHVGVPAGVCHQRR